MIYRRGIGGAVEETHSSAELSVLEKHFWIVAAWRETAGMASIVWGPELAEVYDRVYAAKFQRSESAPILGVLAEFGTGPL